MNLLAVMEQLASGGTEWQAAHILPELARRGWKVHVVNVQAPPQDTDITPLTRRLEDAGISVESLGLSHRWNLAEGSLRLARLCRRYRADIMHARLYFASVHVAATRTLWPRTKRVVSFHNVIYDYPGQSKLDGARKQIEGALVRRGIHGLAAVSTSAAESYRRHLRLGPITVVPNAVPVDEVRPEPGDKAEACRRYGLDPARPLIVVPARQVFEKGHRYLLDAIVQLKAQGVPAQALCLGRGPLLEETQARIRELELSDRVVVADQEAGRAEVLRLMDAADVVALASLFEGFPNVAAEAMAKAKPLVATNIGGLRDLVEDGRTGLLVPPRDGAALAAALARVLADPALAQRLAQAGRAHVTQNFSVPAITDRWEAFYAEVLRG